MQLPTKHKKILPPRPLSPTDPFPNHHNPRPNSHKLNPPNNPQTTLPPSPDTSLLLPPAPRHPLATRLLEEIRHCIHRSRHLPQAISQLSISRSRSHSHTANLKRSSSQPCPRPPRHPPPRALLRLQARIPALPQNLAARHHRGRQGRV